MNNILAPKDLMGKKGELPETCKTMRSSDLGILMICPD